MDALSNIIRLRENTGRYNRLWFTAACGTGIAWLTKEGGELNRCYKQIQLDCLNGSANSLIQELDKIHHIQSKFSLHGHAHGGGDGHANSACEDETIPNKFLQFQLRQSSCFGNG